MITNSMTAKKKKALKIICEGVKAMKMVRRLPWALSLAMPTPQSCLVAGISDIQ